MAAADPLLLPREGGNDSNTKKMSELRSFPPLKEDSRIRYLARKSGSYFAEVGFSHTAKVGSFPVRGGKKRRCFRKLAGEAK